jgi:ribosomal protein S12 methylthiotransferase
MVGFPNETEDDFNILLDFIEEVRFERLGVFTYSKEEGTAAAKLADDVPFEDKECRKETVMQIQWNIASDFAKSKIGEEIDVILETKEDSAYIGRSVWDAPEIDCCVKIQSHEKLNLGEFYKATIIDTDGIDLVGKIKS